MPEKEQAPFCRLFQGHEDDYPPDLLTRLSDLMEDTPENRGTRKRMPGSPPSGYVYFAQFISHELSRDKTPLSHAGLIESEDTWNWRTSRLDLETLYGDGPCSADDYLYDHYHPIEPQGGNCLLLGYTDAVQTSGGLAQSSANDLPRNNSNGEAHVFDPRNDSNLLLAQLHVLLIKFHNRLMVDLIKGHVHSAGPDQASPFEQARRLVTWHYQKIIRDDFLPKVVMPDVLADVTMHWPRLYRPQPNRARLPVEFTLAAYQYGHSAIQNNYSINRYNRPVTQEETMYLTGLARFVRPGSGDPRRSHLPQTFVVNAGRMFGWAAPGNANSSEDIETLIARGLYRVPGSLSRLHNSEPLEDTGLTKRMPPGTFSLPEATLRRGCAVGIQSGQQAARQAGVAVLEKDQLAPNKDIAAFLRSSGMVKRTPLSYYLLREAEISGRFVSAGRRGKRLGPLGSRIVAEVLLGLLEADPNSFVHTDWQPPRVMIRPGRKMARIDTLKKLALYANEYVSP